MSKKGTIEVFQTKISRNDRFAQMSHQEKLIEQKKREIQAKLEQRKAAKDSEASKSSFKDASSSYNKSPAKASTEKNKSDKKAFSFNTFSNDGSFLNQFKQLKEKKLEHKTKSNGKQGSSDCDAERTNKSKWKKDTTSSPPAPNKSKQSRFNTERIPSYEPKINVNANYTNHLFESAIVTAQDVTGQPLLKNLVTQPPSHMPLMMSVPPPQLQLIPTEMTVEMCPTTVIATVALAPPTAVVAVPDNTIITMPPPCMAPLEMPSIPPPNPLQIHSISQPESLNALTIPPPAPLQVQNIPPPSPIQLNEIPNPQPLDLLNIPTPSEEPDPDFIKNVPPPNKSVPPPNLAVPTDKVPTCIPPPNIMPPTSMPPPQQSGGLNILVAQVPQVQLSAASLQQLPPPPIVSQAIMNSIPPLMAQPIMPPPPTMGIVPPPQINVPPPTLIQQSQIQLPPPSFNQQPLISVNVPPPQLAPSAKEMPINSGAGDYEAMASLGRMVAQCGPGIEDIVRQRKIQDPSLWFLYDKNSSAYRQYQQLVEQFKSEMSSDNGGGQHRSSDQDDYRPEEIYESDNCEMSNDAASERANKRKRRSRWGDQVQLPAPSVIAQSTIPAPILPASSTGVMLSKITRHDPGFLAYVRSTYGNANMTEENWRKAEDNYKVHLVYQEMLKKKQDLERIQRSGRNKYEYDSDEETDGGTWEHKRREKEMQNTQPWAEDLTRQADGKHHIGDFLPPEEFRKLFQKTNEDTDASDYSEHRLGEENKGFKMLQKLGWSEGKGLGTTEKGILEPINKGFVSRDGQGLGNQADDTEGNIGEDEYDAYRKRMMLAYKFRPNPLNNPRRAYY